MPEYSIYMQHYWKRIYHRTGPLKGQKWYKRRTLKIVKRKIKPKKPPKAKITLITAFNTRKRPGPAGWMEASFEIWLRNIVIYEHELDEIKSFNWQKICDITDEKLAEKPETQWLYNLKKSQPEKQQIAPYWGIEIENLDYDEPTNNNAEVTVYRLPDYGEIKICKTNLKLTWIGGLL